MIWYTALSVKRKNGYSETKEREKKAREERGVKSHQFPTPHHSDSRSKERIRIKHDIKGHRTHYLLVCVLGNKEIGCDSKWSV